MTSGTAPALYFCYVSIVLTKGTTYRAYSSTSMLLACLGCCSLEQIVLEGQMRSDALDKVLLLPRRGRGTHPWIRSFLKDLLKWSKVSFSVGCLGFGSITQVNQKPHHPWRYHTVSSFFLPFPTNTAGNLANLFDIL